MESCIDRIKNDIEYVTGITATPGRGCTRYSYSPEDKKVRDYLIAEMTGLGMSVRIDGVGNIRARYADEIKDRPAVMIGSHIDTVHSGGKFDGLTGVITSLEVIRTIKENGVSLKNPIELVIFAEEEGSNFGITMLGSKAMTGCFDSEYLKTIYNDAGVSAYQVMSEFGLEADKLKDQVLGKEELKAMIELHVEQGGILDSEEIPFGIVEAIAGMKTFRVRLKGVSNHAGSTPMHLRKDPMAGAAEIILHLELAASQKALKSTVATVGKIHCYPNAPNIISGDIEFYVDIRDVEEEGIAILVEELKRKTEEAAEKRGLAASVDLIGASDCVKLSKSVINAITEAAKEKGYRYKAMNSGAVHDSVMLTGFTDVGMIFVPSINGLSHCPEELTRYEDIKAGCDLLLDTVIKLAN